MIPLPRMGEYTDGIERINIELSLREQARAGRRARSLLRARQPAAGQERRRQRDPVGRAARRPRRSRRWRWCARCAALWQGWLRPTSTTLFPQLQDHSLRARRGRRRSARRCRRSSPAPRSRRSWRECNAIHKRVLQGPRLGRAAHARRRRQRAHQHPGQLRQLRDAAGRARGGRAHHGAGAQPGRRDLGRARHRHHQARVPDRRRARAVRRLQAARRSRGPLQQGQAAARRASTAACCRPT